MSEKKEDDISLLAAFIIPRVTFYKVLLIRRILLVMRPETIKNMLLNLAIQQISVLRRLDFDVKEVGAPVHQCAEPVLRVSSHKESANHSSVSM